jgi:hypothetical protein
MAVASILRADTLSLEQVREHWAIAGNPGLDGNAWCPDVRMLPCLVTSEVNVVSIQSKFIGDFKIGDNIVYNLKVLALLYEQYNAAGAANRRLLCNAAE